MDVGRAARVDPVSHRGRHSSVHSLDGTIAGLPASRRGSPAMIANRTSRPLRVAAIVTLCTAALTLAGWGAESFDPNSQIGPNPKLPEIHQYLFPPIHIASVVGWKSGEAPSVAQGLKIEALATGLQHPRSLYVLPNGDVLVVESKAPPAPAFRRPKDLVMKWVESWATSGGDAGPSNRITLLRDS